MWEPGKNPWTEEGIDKTKCIYCGCDTPSTNEHIVPKDFIRKINYRRYRKIQFPHFHYGPCCARCNKAKLNKLILPTEYNMRTAFVNVPNVLIYDLAEWVFINRQVLNSFLTPDMEVYFEVYQSDVNKVADMFAEGKFDAQNLDKLRTNCHIFNTRFIFKCNRYHN